MVCSIIHLLRGFVRMASIIPKIQWGKKKLLQWQLLHLRGGRVPSPRLIGEVLRDLLDVDVVIDAPVVNKKSKTQARSRSDVRTSAIWCCRNAVGPCYPPFSELASEATALVPAPWSMVEAGLRAVYPDTSGVDLLLGECLLEMCCRNTVKLFYEKVYTDSMLKRQIIVYAMASRIPTFN
jgi:hypothetical protein